MIERIKTLIQQIKNDTVPDEMMDEIKFYLIARNADSRAGMFAILAAINLLLNTEETKAFIELVETIKPITNTSLREREDEKHETTH